MLPSPMHVRKTSGDGPDSNGSSPSGATAPVRKTSDLDLGRPMFTPSHVRKASDVGAEPIAEEEEEEK